MVPEAVILVRRVCLRGAAPAGKVDRHTGHGHEEISADARGDIPSNDNRVQGSSLIKFWWNLEVFLHHLVRFWWELAAYRRSGAKYSKKKALCINDDIYASSEDIYYGSGSDCLGKVCSDQSRQ